MSKDTSYTCNFKTSAIKLRRVKIDDLLKEAQNDNNVKLSIELPEFKTDLKSPDISPEKEICSEDEYIQVLNTKLETMIMEDSDIKEYYSGLQTRLDNKKIDEIYSIVTADISIEPIRRANEKANQSSKKINRHLSPKSDIKSDPVFIQETMIDNIDDENSEEDTSLALYNDNDFDSLSNRIQSGEIGLNDDSSSPSQLSLNFDLNEESTIKNENADLKLAFDMIDGEDESDDISDDSNKSFLSRIFQYKNNTNIKNYEESEDITDSYDGFEYKTKNDKNEAETLLRRAYLASGKKFVLTFIFFLSIFVIEIIVNKSSVLSEYISYKRYGVIYILIQLQIVFLTGAVMRGCLLNGAKSLLTGKLNSDTVFSITFGVSVLHSIYTLFNNVASPSLFLIIPSFISLCISLNSLLKCKKDIYCFSIISSDDVKYAASELASSSKEASKFYSYLLEDSDVYTASKTKFISSFFKRISDTPKSEDILSAIIPGVVFSSALIFSICYFAKHFTLYDSITGTAAFLCTALPATSVFVISLPLISANIKCKKIDSAIIGNCAAEEYSNASVISFEDTELFPSQKVKLTNIKAYYNMRIDQVVVELARIFSYLGGPLKDLFHDAVGGVFEEHDAIKVIESAENGITIAADGADYYLGDGEYMRSHSIEYSDDDEDIAYIKKGGSVMILGTNNIVAAKLFFRYKPQKGFRKLLSHMYESGLCVGIKTLDPNINNSLLSYHAADSQCPISILKAAAPEEIIAIEEKIDSGVVSSRSLGAFLKAFMHCDKSRHSIKSNGIVMVSGVILTVALMLFISFTGDIKNFSPLHAFLFQMMWSLAVWVLSFLK